MQIQFNLTFIRPWSLSSSKFFQAHSLQFLLASIPLDPDSLFGKGAPCSSLAPFAPVGPGGPWGPVFPGIPWSPSAHVTAIPSITAWHPRCTWYAGHSITKGCWLLLKRKHNTVIGAREEKGYLFFWLEGELWASLRWHPGCFLGEMLLIWKINKLGWLRGTLLLWLSISYLFTNYSLHVLVLWDPQIQYFPISQNFKQNLPILNLLKTFERKFKYSENKATKDSNLMESFFLIEDNLG